MKSSPKPVFIEIQIVNPRVLLAIGAPAARVLIERDFRLQEQRGQLMRRADGRQVIATLQPAYVMRLTSLVDREASRQARELLVQDVKTAVQAARGTSGHG